MSAGHTVTVRPADAHVEVRLGDETLAATDRALRVSETGLPDRFYLPKSDVRMDRLTPTTLHTTCPFKGEASYWSVESGGTTHDGIVWGYDSPKDDVAEIADHVSFYPDRVDITVDGEAVTA